MPEPKKPNKPLPPEKRKHLDQIKKVDMLATVIRNPDVFASVRDVLKTSYVRDGIGEAYGIVYQAVCAFYGKYGELPSGSILLDEIHSRLLVNPNLLVNDEPEMIDEFIKAAYRNSKRPANPLYAKLARENCRLFLEDQVGEKLQESVQDGRVPVNMASMITMLQQELESVQSIEESPADVLYAEGWDTTPRPSLFRTGVDPLDHFLGGGHCGKEVYVILGPTGACKTLMAAQAIVGSARLAADLYGTGRSKDGKKPVAVYVSAETPKTEFRQRALQYAAMLHKDVVAALTSLNDLPDTDQPTEAEKIHFQDQIESGDGFLSQRQRAINWARMANEHVLFVDLTDSNEANQHAGKGGIPELARVLSSTFRQRPDCYPLCFWVDHAYALALRIMTGNGIPFDQIRFILGAMPMQCRDLIAKPYEAPLWILHQLSGVSNSRGPTAKMHYTDAAECKLFAQLADFSFEVGTGTKEQLFQLGCSKHRRQPPRSEIPIQVDGPYNRVIDRSKTHVIDRGLRRIILHKELTAYEQQGRVMTKQAEIKEQDLQDGVKMEDFP